MELDIPASWHGLRETLIAEQHVAMVVGGERVGKSTLTGWLAAELAGAGRRVGLLDTDPRRAHIGPPGTVGLAQVRRRFAAYGELNPSALFFIGALSPQGMEPAFFNGVTKLMKLARRQGNHAVLVDTGGYLEPGFLEACWRAVEPTLVIVMGDFAGALPEGVRSVVLSSTGTPLDGLEPDPFQEYFAHGKVWSVLPVQVRVLSTRGVDAPLIPGTLVGLVDGPGVCHGVGVALTPSREGSFRIYSPIPSMHPIQRVLTGTYTVPAEQLKAWMTPSVVPGP